VYSVAQDVYSVADNTYIALQTTHRAMNGYEGMRHKQSRDLLAIENERSSLPAATTEKGCTPVPIATPSSEEERT
jgi:hypothetical protein